MIQKTKRSIQWVKNKQPKNQSPQIATNDLYWGDNCAGIHLIAEFWDGKVIEDKKELENILVQAAKEANSTVLEVKIHKFAPQGIAGVVLLAESHISFHSWPERGYAAIDIFTCGRKTNPSKALEYLKTKFQPKKVNAKEFKRGEKV